MAKPRVVKSCDGKPGLLSYQKKGWPVEREKDCVASYERRKGVIQRLWDSEKVNLLNKDGRPRLLGGRREGHTMRKAAGLIGSVGSSAD